MSSSLVIKMVDKPAGAKDVPRCRLKEFNGSGYRRRTIMDNNDQTVTKLGRNGVSGRFLPVDDAALQRHISMHRTFQSFLVRDTKEEKLVVSTFENSQNVN